MLTLLLASRSPASSETLAEPPACPPLIQGRPANMWLCGYLSGLPDIHGGPVHLQFLPQLTAHRGKLLTSEPERGKAVHAASFLRERCIVLEDALIRRPSLLRLMLTHEIFHFVWIHLSNESRHGFERVLVREHRARVAGELGESADVAKESLQPDDMAQRSLRWRNYVCESFCDTAAWMYGGVKRHPYFRLTEERRAPRAAALASIRTFRA